MLFASFEAEAIEQVRADVSSKKSEKLSVVVPKDSVLHLIPQETLGVIYCPSLSELNNRINMMTADMLPQLGQAELLAEILAGAFGAGFESLAELEEIGLDLNKDFAIFLTNLMPMKVAATVHVTDPEAIKQVITNEAEGSTPTEYKGVTYWSSAEGGGNFVILENILVFSQQPEVCKNVIDTQNGTMQAITHDPDYGMFLSDILKGTDQLGLYFDVEAITTKLEGPLAEKLEAMRGGLEGEEDPLSISTGSVIKNLVSSWAELIEQLQFLSATLQVLETDVQLKSFLKFKNGSEILKEIKQTSSELPNIGDLPNLSMMNAAFQGVPKVLVEMSTFWFGNLPKAAPGQQKELHPLFQEVKAHYESLAERWNMSVNFTNFILPDYLFVYELRDEPSAKAFMDGEFLKKLHDHYDAKAGKSVMHNGVEIKSYIFPNLNLKESIEKSVKEAIEEDVPDMFLDFSQVIPSEWHWYYAFTNGHLFWTTGNSPDSIKTALDRKTGIGDKFSANPSYQKLVESLGTDNNVFLAISPIITVKNFMPLLGKMNQDLAAAMQMIVGMFMNLPDNYSIGFSAKAEDDGIDAKLLLTLGDFKPLIQMFGMLFGAAQMQ